MPSSEREMHQGSILMYGTSICVCSFLFGQNYWILWSSRLADFWQRWKYSSVHTASMIEVVHHTYQQQIQRRQSGWKRKKGGGEPMIGFGPMAYYTDWLLSSKLILHLILDKETTLLLWDENTALKNFRKWGLDLFLHLCSSLFWPWQRVRTSLRGKRWQDSRKYIGLGRKL